MTLYVYYDIYLDMNFKIHVSIFRIDKGKEMLLPMDNEGWIKI